jgi:hypothetical protein
MPPTFYRFNNYEDRYELFGVTVYAIMSSSDHIRRNVLYSLFTANGHVAWTGVRPIEPSSATTSDNQCLCTEIPSRKLSQNISVSEQLVRGAHPRSFGG